MIVPKNALTTRKHRGALAPPSVGYEPWLIERLKDPGEAAAYLEAVIDEGEEGAEAFFGLISMTRRNSFSAAS